MEAWIIWLIIAAVLVIVEVLSQMVWTLCLAVGCLGSLVAALWGVGTVWQIVVLAIVSVMAFIVLMPLFKKWHDRRHKLESRDDRTGMDALLGRRAVVTETIHPGKLGRARIDGDNWQVRTPHDDSLVERGKEVVVSAYDSIILTVEPA